MAVTLMGSALNNIHIGNSGGGSSSGGGASVGTFASRPAAGTAGRIYIATDSPIAQWVDDGSAWRPMLLGQALGTQVPAASSFTTFGGGSFQMYDLAGTINFSATGNSQTSLCGGVVSASGSSLYVEGSVISTIGSGASYCDPQVFLRESSTGKAVSISLQKLVSSSQFRIFTTLFSNNARTSETAGAAVPFSYTHDLHSRIIVRLKVSGANIVCEYSSDRVNWFTINTHAISTSFTSAPDQVGFGYMHYNSGGGSLVHFQYGSL